jgi:hypothetical protein
MNKEGLRFDWYPIITNDFISNLASEVISCIEKGRTNTRGISKSAIIKRNQDQLIIAKHLLSALYFAHFTLTTKKTPLGVSIIKKTSGYSINKTKYPTRIHYSFRYFVSVLKAFEKLKWISIDKGNVLEGYTRIHAINRLKSTFDNLGLIWTKQEPKPLEDLIILRDRIEIKTTSQGHSKVHKRFKNITLELPNSIDVDRMANNLYGFNKFLLRHCITLNVTDEKLHKIAKALAGNRTKNNEEVVANLDFSKVQLRRIFSRGSLTKHGRFYNGWWQSIPSMYRQHIEIDGYKTSEVDFSNMSLRIIYALKGIKCNEKDDMYDIGLDNWAGLNDQRRKLIKVFINAMMNDEKGTFKLNKTELESLGLTHKDLIRLVLKRHEPIADKLTAGVGMQATYIDSQIADLVMRTMQADNIVTLPIHDSFIVRTGYQDWLKVVMESAFKTITDGKISTEADGPRLLEHFGLTKEQFKKTERELINNPSKGIVASNNLELDTIFEKTIMRKYLSHWEQWIHKTSNC